MDTIRHQDACNNTNFFLYEKKNMNLWINVLLTKNHHNSKRSLCCLNVFIPFLFIIIITVIATTTSTMISSRVIPRSLTYSFNLFIYIYFSCNATRYYSNAFYRFSFFSHLLLWCRIKSVKFLYLYLLFFYINFSYISFFFSMLSSQHRIFSIEMHKNKLYSQGKMKRFIENLSQQCTFSPRFFILSIYDYIFHFAKQIRMTWMELFMLS